MTPKDYRMRAACVALGLLLPGAVPAIAGGFTAGVDYQQGPGGRNTRSALGRLTLPLPPADLYLAGIHYDDSRLGTGFGLTAAGRVTYSLVGARASASRYEGVDGYSAWRLRAGPEVQLPTGQRFSILADHYSSSLDASANGYQLHAESPLFPGLTGTASWASEHWSDGHSTQELWAGARLGLLSHFELTGALGGARTRHADAVPEGTRRGLMPPLLGDGGPDSPPTTTNDGFTGSARIGIRVTLP